MPTEVGLLSSLEFIGADLTFLTGSIPTEIGNLGATLHTFQVRGADMGGTSIPSELGRCTSLGTSLLVRCGYPYHARCIVTQTFILSLLEMLMISLSNFGGTLPSELGHLTSMTLFEADDNYFVGTFPNEFENLVALETFAFRGVETLSGTIPSGMCNINVNGGMYVGHNVECACCDTYDTRHD